MTPAVPASNQIVPLYAQVAFPVHLGKTFTYRLPSSIQPVARVGSRVVAQLGAKPLTGYIVALLPRLRSLPGVKAAGVATALLGHSCDCPPHEEHPRQRDDGARRTQQSLSP